MIKKIIPKCLLILVIANLFGCIKCDENKKLCETALPPKRIEYLAPRQLSVVSDKRIKEASGLACSGQTPQAFWTHNDSGDGPNIYLINFDGKTLMSGAIEGAKARDWEDIASFKINTQAYLLIADVGDNKRKRQQYALYIIKEPLNDSSQQKNNWFKLEKTILFQYEDGPQNCESVGVDVTAAKINLVSKQGGKECKVYELPLILETNKKIETAQAIAVLNIPTIVAMDISPDGQRTVILTHNNEAYEYTRLAGESWTEGFAREPRILKMPRMKQGEAICYGQDGYTIYLVSEHAFQPLWEVQAVLQ